MHQLASPNFSISYSESALNKIITITILLKNNEKECSKFNFTPFGDNHIIYLSKTLVEPLQVIKVEFLIEL